MKKSISILLVVLLFASTIDLFAQKFAVYFTDKDNSPYSISNPEAFLSQRSLDRRARYGVDVTVQDLPVNEQYVEALRNLGATVPFTSKWLNCALVSCPQSLISQIEALPFVSHVVYASPQSYGGKQGEGLPTKFANKLESEKDFLTIDTKNIDENYNYGSGYGQINQLNGIPVHEQGYTGDGVLIAVLDAGFQNVNSLGVFSSIYSEGRMVLARDIVNPGGNIYASGTSNHGTNVLSCMSANADGSFVGTAPKASFALLRTEDAATEYLIECYNWVVGMEVADSIGADIINSSLSYSTFDDVSMNYTYSQTNGETPVASYAAERSIERGIFITVSAGNSNGTSWPWVGTPADATHAATIGAVNSSGNITSFSSIGPNGAGTPKPNTLAEGASATVYSTSGNISSSSGTSFSSPITCGMYACLIQANPSIHPALLRDIVDGTGNRYPNHDIAYGYGIPNFATALETILAMSVMEITNVEVVDAAGNNNGRLNPGETVSLNITVKNKSSEAMTNVTSVISTIDTNVNFINNTANFGNFAPDETKTINNVFSFVLSEQAIANNTIRFNVIASHNGENIQCIFDIIVYDNLLQYQSHAIDDNSGNSNGMLDPGETVDIYVNIINNGNENATGVTAVLLSTSSDITINTNSFNLGNFNISQSKFAKYNVTLSNSATPGNINIPFELLLTDSEGKTTIHNFTYSDKCNIIFELLDSYGDGWNGASITVTFDDGTPTQNLTITGANNSATHTIAVSTNVNLTLAWVAGAWDSECSFVVKYEDGTVIFNSPSAPSAGVFYSFLNNCGAVAPPPPPPLHAAQYAVHFKDKNDSPYSINVPLEFLSQKALDRRAKYGISVTEDDFPVNQNYIESVNSTGAYVHSSSRWSNSVLVYAEDEMLDQINNLACVEKTVYVKPAEGKFKKYDIHPKWEKYESFEPAPQTKDGYEYGYAFEQINQLNGIPVHEKGYTGAGVLIAVLDAGFQHTDIIAGFTHLFDSDRIVMAKDLVEQGKNVYETDIHHHGTHVLSCMGGYIENQFVGTAPMASYALIRTEDARTEFLIEEYFWMIGAEIADSIGADIINSSLSYSTFDDASMNHVYSEMDGITAVSSLAAKMAAERGIFSTVSAGNSNGTSWPWVGTPADTPEALTIGAVDVDGNIASFSSIGPNGAGAPKPNVLARGASAYIISATSGTVASGSGTSFSSPITCGMIACVIQAAPNKTVAEIHAAVEQSANRYPTYDIALGYGIPNFGDVLEILEVLSVDNYKSTNLTAYPNPVNNSLHIENTKNLIKTIDLYDIAGKLVKKITVNNYYANIDVNELNKGLFFVKAVYDNYSTETIKIIKE